MCTNLSVTIRGTNLTLIQLLMWHKTFDVRIDLEKIPHATLLDPNIGFGSAGRVFTTVTKNDMI